MKIYRIPELTILFCCWILAACNTATPENYFDRAVLSSNMIVGFASDRLLREFDSPPAKMEEGTKKVVAVKCKEVIETKIQFLEDNMAKLKQLKETPEIRDMLQASAELNGYVLPVYKTEYLQLAKLYDESGSKEEIQALSQTINRKYYSRFDELFTKLTNVGKVYAEKNNIKVNWGN